MNRSTEINELASALAKAQSVIKPAEFDGMNPAFKARYATLASIQNACRDALSKNGLAITQGVRATAEGAILETALLHASGQWMSSEMLVHIDANARNYMQSLGSAITYARRYSLAAMVGVVADEDDDGNAATREQPSAPVKKVQTAKPANHAPQAALSTAEEAANYVATFGKYKGQTIQEIDPNDLGEYCEFILKKAKEENKQPTGQVQDFLRAAEMYLKEM